LLTVLLIATFGVYLTGQQDNDVEQQESTARNRSKQGWTFHTILQSTCCDVEGL